MELQTERLKLVELSLDDLTDIHQLHSMPQTDEFNTLGIPGSIQITEKLLNEWIEKRTQTPP